MQAIHDPKVGQAKLLQFVDIIIEICIGLAEKTLHRRPIGLRHRLVHQRKSPLPIFDKDEVGICVDDLSKRGFRPLNAFIQPLAFRHVTHETAMAWAASLLITVLHQNNLVQKCRAIFPHRDRSEFSPPIAHHRLKGCLCDRQTVRMDYAGPVLADERGGLISEQPCIGVVQRQILSNIIHPRKAWHREGQRPVHLLRRLLCLLSHGDVSQDHQGRKPIRTFVAGRDDLRHDRAPVKRDHSNLFQRQGPALEGGDE